ncbi:MAG: ATP-binding protein [Bacteroidota bacterium]|uniref:ATP-binding protein n=1 Tax=Parabacteroides sp. FAFU027 TaxID=2922715 RepID=UPI001FAE81EF|nr:ATP-binding protein [Parabacteroides sp. FAFU027]MDP4270584.1 ATP-binding protein [Bacteroidota bacterium]
MDKGIIKVLTGQRRVGKSYILMQLIKDIKQANPEANTIYINKELEEFRSIHDDADLFSYANERILPGVKNYLFIDEIQDIKGFEHVLRSYQAEMKCEIICTGSNAKMLSSELSTYLSGRYIEFRIHSLNYSEFLEFHQLSDDDKALRQFLTYGGLPYLSRLGLEDELAIEYLKNVYSTILLKDVISRENIRNVDFLETLVEYIADNVGSLFSASNIHKYLKSQKVDISVNLIINYLRALSNAFIIHKVRRIDIKGLKKFEIGDKFFFEDLGLRNCLQNIDFSRDIHKLMENCIYQHLQILGYEVYVGQLDNLEIDFVGIKKGRKVYIQSTYLIPDEKTHEREFGNLLKIADSYPKYVVSMDAFNAGGNYQGIHHVYLRDFLKMSEL